VKLSELIDGLNILVKYFDDPDSYNVGAEHDVIYVYPTDRPVDKEDVKALIELGWFQEDVEIDDDDADFSPEHYSPEETWSHYT
jgi:hypothetical protein